MRATVGMVGLGVLGSAIVPDLIRSGFALAGYDIDRVKVEGLAREGMVVAGRDPPGSGNQIVAGQQYGAAVAHGHDEDHAAVSAAMERTANRER